MLLPEDLICQGQIVHINGFLSFPDGSHICRYPATGNLKETINKYYQWQPTTTSASSEFKWDPPPHITTANVLITPDLNAFLFHCAPVVKNNAVVVETIEDELNTLAIT